MALADMHFTLWYSAFFQKLRNIQTIFWATVEQFLDMGQFAAHDHTSESKSYSSSQQVSPAVDEWEQFGSQWPEVSEY